jgi:hypothetical protein
VERVTSGLRCTRINLQPLARYMLKVADRLATLLTVVHAHIHDVPDAAITEDLSAVYLRSAGR